MVVTDWLIFSASAKALAPSAPILLLFKSICDGRVHLQGLGQGLGTDFPNLAVFQIDVSDRRIDLQSLSQGLEAATHLTALQTEPAF
eukprot:s1997_g13.t1